VGEISVKDWSGGLNQRFPANRISENECVDATDISLTNLRLSRTKGVDTGNTAQGDYRFRGEWVTDATADKFVEYGTTLLKSYDSGTKLATFTRLKTSGGAATSLDIGVPPKPTSPPTTSSQATAGNESYAAALCHHSVPLKFEKSGTVVTALTGDLSAIDSSSTSPDVFYYKDGSYERAITYDGTSLKVYNVSASNFTAVNTAEDGGSAAAASTPNYKAKWWFQDEGYWVGVSDVGISILNVTLSVPILTNTALAVISYTAASLNDTDVADADLTSIETGEGYIDGWVAGTTSDYWSATGTSTKVLVSRVREGNWWTNSAPFYYGSSTDTGRVIAKVRNGTSTDTYGFGRTFAVIRKANSTLKINGYTEGETVTIASVDYTVGLPLVTSVTRGNFKLEWYDMHPNLNSTVGYSSGRKGWANLDAEIQFKNYFTGSASGNVFVPGHFEANGEIEFELSRVVNAVTLSSSTISTANETITITAHGIADGSLVTLAIDTLGTLPTGLALDTDYYVVSGAADTIKLSLTSGGSAVNITGVGSGTLTVTSTTDADYLVVLGFMDNQAAFATTTDRSWGFTTVGGGSPYTDFKFNDEDSADTVMLRWDETNLRINYVNRDMAKSTNEDNSTYDDTYPDPHQYKGQKEYLWGTLPSAVRTGTLIHNTGSVYPLKSSHLSSITLSSAGSVSEDYHNNQDFKEPNYPVGSSTRAYLNLWNWREDNRILSLCGNIQGELTQYVSATVTDTHASPGGTAAVNITTDSNFSKANYIDSEKTQEFFDNNSSKKTVLAKTTIDANYKEIESLNSFNGYTINSVNYVFFARNYGTWGDGSYLFRNMDIGASAILDLLNFSSSTLAALPASGWSGFDLAHSHSVTKAAHYGADKLIFSNPNLDVLDPVTNVLSTRRSYGVTGTVLKAGYLNDMPLSDTTPTPSSAWQTSQTHAGATQTSTSGSGTGAKFGIVTDGSGNPTFTVTALGSGYAVSDTIVVTDPGSTSNTATVTVASFYEVLVYVPERGEAHVVNVLSSNERSVYTFPFDEIIKYDSTLERFFGFEWDATDSRYEKYYKAYAFWFSEMIGKTITGGTTVADLGVVAYDYPVIASTDRVRHILFTTTTGAHLFYWSDANNIIKVNNSTTRNPKISSVPEIIVATGTYTTSGATIALDSSHDKLRVQIGDIVSVSGGSSTPRVTVKTDGNNTITLSGAIGSISDGVVTATFTRYIHKNRVWPHKADYTRIKPDLDETFDINNYGSSLVRVNVLVFTDHANVTGIEHLPITRSTRDIIFMGDYFYVDLDKHLVQNAGGSTTAGDDLTLYSATASLNGKQSFSIPSASLSVTGGIDYQYRYSFLRDLAETGEKHIDGTTMKFLLEGPPSDESPEISSGFATATDFLRLGFTGSVPTGVTKVRVYRVGGNFASWAYIADLDIDVAASTLPTRFDDTSTNVAAFSIQPQLDLNPPTEAMTYITYVSGIFFAADDSRLYFSKFASYHSFNEAAYLEFDARITGIEESMGEGIIFTDGQVYRVRGFDPFEMTSIVVPDVRGLPENNRRTLTKWGTNVIWLGNEGVCVYSNGNVQVISNGKGEPELFEMTLPRGFVKNNVYYLVQTPVADVTRKGFSMDFRKGIPPAITRISQDAESVIQIPSENRVYLKNSVNSAYKGAFLEGDSQSIDFTSREYDGGKVNEDKIFLRAKLFYSGTGTISFFADDEATAFAEKTLTDSTNKRSAYVYPTFAKFGKRFYYKVSGAVTIYEMDMRIDLAVEYISPRIFKWADVSYTGTPLFALSIDEVDVETTPALPATTRTRTVRVTFRGGVSGFVPHYRDVSDTGEVIGARYETEDA